MVSPGRASAIRRPRRAVRRRAHGGDIRASVLIEIVLDGVSIRRERIAGVFSHLIRFPVMSFPLYICLRRDQESSDFFEK